ncbi:uncharacterized protein I206_101570 [Kwoniella pini CBS 10737]|uniref:Uncharacterized protein n=1 Tax=Kwoniella pini CBS 10737 TaxID=1296096 RepID=A0A1B9HWA1_9TREE|nr:uncharacterized protein I206_06460 [Kwoniella pini CBS 10737]OCF47557.1 hypothetical protein I206_06460 [Kwoniella pini CBS 10737]
MPGNSNSTENSSNLTDGTLIAENSMTRARRARNAGKSSSLHILTQGGNDDLGFDGRLASLISMQYNINDVGSISYRECIGRVGYMTVN